MVDQDLPVLAEVFRRRKRAVGSIWRMDETYIKVGGGWKYLYRAVDREGGARSTYSLRARRDHAAARLFLERAIDLHGVPEKITIDKSGANMAAIEGISADSGADIGLRQSKYLNNIVEQDHRAIKRIVRPMMGFKAFRCARIILAGIETHAHDQKRGSRSAPKSKLCPQHRSSTHWPFDHRPINLTFETRTAIATEPVVLWGLAFAMSGVRSMEGVRRHRGHPTALCTACSAWLSGARELTTATQ